ncbi:MAG: hypothetical protein P1V20_15485 [Verrucomicrobiales bacterium]|nr:hypothetical protein [Verrucomicrobiales bacterium]
MPEIQVIKKGESKLSTETFESGEIWSQDKVQSFDKIFLPELGQGELPGAVPGLPRSFFPGSGPDDAPDSPPLPEPGEPEVEIKVTYVGESRILKFLDGTELGLDNFDSIPDELRPTFMPEGFGGLPGMIQFVERGGEEVQTLTLTQDMVWDIDKVRTIETIRRSDARTFEMQVGDDLIFGFGEYTLTLKGFFTLKPEERPQIVELGLFIPLPPVKDIKEVIEEGAEAEVEKAEVTEKDFSYEDIDIIDAENRNSLLELEEIDDGFNLPGIGVSGGVIAVGGGLIDTSGGLLDDVGTILDVEDLDLGDLVDPVTGLIDGALDGVNDIVDDLGGIIAPVVGAVPPIVASLVNNVGNLVINLTQPVTVPVTINVTVTPPGVGAAPVVVPLTINPGDTISNTVAAVTGVVTAVTTSDPVVSLGSILGSVIPPVVVDLDGDGVEFADDLVSFDIDDDGQLEQVKWAGKDDGFLVFDENQNGLIDQRQEIVFTEHAPDAETDLEAIRTAFDSDNDGLLTENDEAWEQFGIWQDANLDGVTDPGELQTLSDLGVQSIGLTNDGNSDTSISGVIVHGESILTYEDGSTTAVGDVSLQVLDMVDVSEIIEAEEDVDLGSSTAEGSGFSDDSSEPAPGDDAPADPVAAAEAAPDSPAVEIDAQIIPDQPVIETETPVAVVV